MTDVLACLDFSERTEAVAAEAARLATAIGGSLHLLHVAGEEPEIAGYDTDPMGAFTRDDRARQLLDEHHELRELAARLADGGLDVRPVVAIGDTVAVILEEAERTGADYIVVGTHGHGALFHLLLGSVSAALVQHATRPVVVVPVRPAEG